MSQNIVMMRDSLLKVVRSHFPGVPIHSDIRDYHPEPGEFDIISCGFPCTGTSNAGTRTGLQHPASSLWREGFRCLIEAQPRFCIMEQPEGFIISYPDEQRLIYEQQTCWSDQMREMVQRQKLNQEWLSVRNECDRSNNGLSVELVRGSNTTILEESDYIEPSKTPGRIRARYLAGRTVTPGQAAIALRRVLYLNSITGGRGGIART